MDATKRILFKQLWLSMMVSFCILMMMAFTIWKISETDNLFIIYSNRPLSRVGVNSVICMDNNGKPEIEGYWGNITLSKNNNLYLYQIHIKSNNSGKDRYFQLKFGSGETFCIVNVLQQYCL